MPDSIQEWQRGRAHFTDSTIIFCRHLDTSKKTPEIKLVLVENDKFEEVDAICEIQQTKMSLYGQRYPVIVQFYVGKKMRLKITHKEVLASNLFHLRFLSEISLTLNDGKSRKTLGLTEHLSPKRLKYRWIDWLLNMKIGKNGKGAFLP